MSSRKLEISGNISCNKHRNCKDLTEAEEATVRTGHGTMDWFQIGKEVRQAVYCHPAYLIYMQSTS